ncbi:NUDIX domain-containing protein [Brachybacterium fresconis]|uniref:ADP-ribose pyrophosphatase n=1 Tax=Brachybacterium fresconis TaxID=173363 RepID=A0ABS4YE74_9MICO|nr:NUDIX hydrolase [Brachybacterium fresconis]MBP2407109.1 ADP-ribose pyrophosphatase [Brachybacterium fresconis]
MTLTDEPGARPVTNRTTVHSGMVFDIVRDTVDFAPGVQFDREYMRHPGAVAVLAVDEQDHVLLIRQYRHPVGHTLWEIPAGLLDVDGEDPHVGALRELGEETGRTAARLRTLVDLRPSPGGSDEVIRIYLATGARALEEATGFERTDEEAEIETRWLPLADAVTAVLEGRLTNATTVTAVLALAAHRARGGDDGMLRAADAPFLERPGRD